MSPTTPVEGSAAKSAWVQLYEARNIPVEVQTRSPGRPPGPVPRHKVGMTLSQGEIAEIEVWQERLSSLLHRKISIGETVGLLARLSTARFAAISAHQSLQALAELVEKMIGQE
jgi:hypothetical protein